EGQLYSEQKAAAVSPNGRAVAVVSTETSPAAFANRVVGIFAGDPRNALAGPDVALKVSFYPPDTVAGELHIAPGPGATPLNLAAIPLNGKVTLTITPDPLGTVSPLGVYVFDD